MAATNPSGIKMYLRRKFTTGGAGITYNGTSYAATEAGMIAFADAVFAEASSEVVIIQIGFEGGYSTGQIKCDKNLLMLAIEELMEEFGFGVDTSRRAMIFADYSNGIATT